MTAKNRFQATDALDALRKCKERYEEEVNSEEDGSSSDTITTDMYDSVRDEDWPSSSTIIRMYGSWAEAKKAAGIGSNRSQKYSDEELLQFLKDCKDTYGSVSPRNFKKGDYCSVSAIMTRFGSWSEAKECAGIEEDLSSNTGRGKGWSDEQILSHLREVHRRLEEEEEGRSLTIETLQELGETPDDQDRRFVSPSVVIERFGDGDEGGWITAKRKAGLAESVADGRKNNQRPEKWTKEEYLEKLKECNEKFGKVTQRLLDELSKGEIECEDGDEWPSSAGVRKKFGSWSKAKQKAGVDSGPNYKHSDEELLDMLKKCKDRYGRCTANKFGSDDDFCSPETVQRRFGSWSDGKKQAGIQ